MPAAAPYGYRAVPGKPGELAIEPDEAEIVRRIFREGGAGRTPQAIVADLNADRAASPRSRAWMAATLKGNKQRGHGILVNPTYGGEIVWNRVRMIKDPATGKRVSRINSVADWQRTPVRTLPSSIATSSRGASHGRRARGAQEVAAPQPQARSFGPAEMPAAPEDRSAALLRIVCTTARKNGSCTNTRTFYLEYIEAKISGGLKQRLGTREAIAVYLKTYNDERPRACGRHCQPPRQSRTQAGPDRRSHRAHGEAPHRRRHQRS